MTSMVGLGVIRMQDDPMLTETGTLARVGPNELITDDPEVLRKMMAARSEYTRGHCKKSLLHIERLRLSDVQGTML
jgi:hypothetical protein